MFSFSFTWRKYQMDDSYFFDNIFFRWIHCGVHLMVILLQLSPSASIIRCTIISFSLRPKLCEWKRNRFVRCIAISLCFVMTIVMITSDVTILKFIVYIFYFRFILTTMNDGNEHLSNSIWLSHRKRIDRWKKRWHSITNKIDERNNSFSPFRYIRVRWIQRNLVNKYLLWILMIY